MLTSTGPVITSGLAILGLLSAAPPVSTDDAFGSVSCAQAPSAACEINVGSSGGSRGTPHTGSQPASRGASGVEPETLCVPAMPPGLTSPADQEAWRQFACATSGSASASFGVSGIVLSPEDVAAVARARLRLPAPALAANPQRLQLVRLPTWLWLSSGWVPVSATASVPALSVTATATPTSVTWSMGDGSTVTCAGAGTPYVAGTAPEAPSPDCGHVYRRSSANQAGQAFPVTATVHWTVSWSGAGQGGTFPDMTTTGSTTFRVAESQALNNGDG
jgi:hypothetical protein